MPPELEWFANLDNPRTRRAYRLDVQDFTAFAGVQRPEGMRQVTRAHPPALERIHDYLHAAGHGQDAEGPLGKRQSNTKCND